MLDFVPPEEARCLGCGYLLRGLPQPVCPECGKSFDPTDPATFDTRPPGWRRRRWIKRAVVLAFLGLIVYGLAPRGLMKGTITLTCARCGQETTSNRYQLRPPSWVPFRYPGIHQRRASLADASVNCLAGAQHRLGVKVRADVPSGGFVTGTADPAGALGKIYLDQIELAAGPEDAIEKICINGIEVSLESAKEILRKLHAPGNDGIMIGPCGQGEPDP